MRSICIKFFISTAILCTRALFSHQAYNEGTLFFSDPHVLSQIITPYQKRPLSILTAGALRESSLVFERQGSPFNKGAHPFSQREATLGKAPCAEDTPSSTKKEFPICDMDFSWNSAGNALCLLNLRENSCDQTISTIFYTLKMRDQDWRVPSILSQSSHEAYSQARISMDPDGNAIAVWCVTNQDESLNRIESIFYKFNLYWSPLLTITPINTKVVHGLSLYTGSCEKALAVWLEENPDGTRSLKCAQVNFLENFKEWTLSSPLFEEAKDVSSFPNVAIDSQNKATMSWAKKTGCETIFYSSTLDLSLDSQNWSAPQMISINPSCSP